MKGELRKRLRHLPAALAATAVLGVVGVVVGALVRGPVAAAGVAAGVGLVAGSYTFSSLVIAWTDSVNPALLLPVGLLTYVVKFTLIGLGMAALAATHWAGLVPMGIGVVAAVLTWAGTQTWWTWHARIPYVELG